MTYVNGHDGGQFGSIEAEHAVLGALLLDNNAMARAAPLEPDDFAYPEHGAIFATMREMISSGVQADVVTVPLRLAASGRLGECFQRPYLNTLTASTPSAANIVGYSRIVRDEAQKRDLAAAKERAANLIATTADPAEGLVLAERTVREAMAGRVMRRHPLANFVDLGLNAARRPEFVIDDVLAAGIVVIAGGRGTGKTTAMLPVAACAAHLCRADHPLKPKLRRRVIWITEDTEHARSVLYSWVNFGGAKLDETEVFEWFRLVPAARMPVEQVVQVASEYVQLSHVNRGRSGVEYETMPLVVFDTVPSVIETEDENSNARGSAVIAQLKQRFGMLPAWLIMHTAESGLAQRPRIDDHARRGLDRG